MPDWDSSQLREIRAFIVKYITALNARDVNMLSECFTANAVLHRAMRNYAGRKEIVGWFRSQLAVGKLRFELLDASAGVFPDSNAICILWLEIHARGHNLEKKDIHIETLDLIEKKGRWAIRRCFGLGYNPQEHKKYFRRFLEDSRP